MTECVFCRLAAQPAGTVIASNELAFAILDRRPIRPGHALVIPRRHEPDFLGLSDDELLAVLSLARQVGSAQRQLFEPKKVGLLVAGFDVPHAHLHVVPMHDYHDLTSKPLLEGALPTASDQELDDIVRRFADTL